jgi:hypothetical protein
VAAKVASAAVAIGANAADATKAAPTKADREAILLFIMNSSVLCVVRGCSSRKKTIIAKAVELADASDFMDTPTANHHMVTG